MRIQLYQEKNLMIKGSSNPNQSYRNQSIKSSKVEHSNILKFYIRKTNGEGLLMNKNCHTTICQIKKVIQQQLKISQIEQLLVFNGFYLNEQNKNLKDIGIDNLSIVHLIENRITFLNEIFIYVQSDKNQKFRLSVKLTTKIQVLKYWVSGMINIPQRYIVLIYCGKILKPNVTVEQSFIKIDAIVRVVDTRLCKKQSRTKLSEKQKSNKRQNLPQRLSPQIPEFRINSKVRRANSIEMEDSKASEMLTSSIMEYSYQIGDEQRKGADLNIISASIRSQNQNNLMNSQQYSSQQ